MPQPTTATVRPGALDPGDELPDTDLPIPGQVPGNGEEPELAAMEAEGGGLAVALLVGITVAAVVASQ